MTAGSLPSAAPGPLSASPDPLPVSPSAARGLAGLRLVRLHLSSRRVPAALVALAACGAVLRAALHWHWIAGSGIRAQELPAIIEAGTASVIAVTTRSPFGDPERATGRWLPYLRLATVVLLAGAAVAALAAGAAAAHLSGGTLPVLRNVAGATGIGLLAAAVAGGALAWIGPVAYTMVGGVRDYLGLAGAMDLASPPANNLHPTHRTPAGGRDTQAPQFGSVAPTGLA